MIRKLGGLMAALLLLVAAEAGAHEMSMMHKHMAMGKPATLTGEVVDTGCYLGHAARGEKHVECATKCIDNGMPMGLLTSKGALYLITLNHDDADPYHKLKEMAVKTVTVTGMVMERNGMKGIDVTEVKPAASSTKSAK